MDTVIAVVLVSALLIVGAQRYDLVLKRRYQKQKEEREAAVAREQVHTVAMMAATMISGLLANSKLYEVRSQWADKRDHYSVEIFCEESAAIREGRVPDVETLKSLERTMSDCFQAVNVFNRKTRRQIIDLAWDTLDDTRARAKSWPAPWTD